MNVTARSYLTAGVAVLGAGAVALTPVQPIPNNLALAQDKAVANLAVNLASSIDPITPWIDTFKLSAENLGKLAEFYLEKPLPLLQTIGANIGTYLGELPDLNLIFSQITGNIQTFFQAPWWNSEGAVIPNGTYASEYISNTQTVRGVTVLFGSQSAVYNVVAPLLASQGPEWLGPVLEFTATPYSGQLIGLLSPALSSLVQLTRSFTAVGQFFQDGDLIGAINELINIPANVTNAALNGAGNLDLTEIARNILPPALASLVQALGVNLGGLISPPVPFNGSLVNTANPPTVFTGGTLFDGVSTRVPIAGANTTGLPVGWAGSVIGMGQFLSEALLVTPGSGASVAPTASVRAAAAAEDPAPVEVKAPAPAVDNTPAPTLADDRAPLDDDPAPVINVPAKAEAPAPQTVSTPAPRKRSAASDNDDNGGGSRGSHKGARGKHAA